MPLPQTFKPETLLKESLRFVAGRYRQLPQDRKTRVQFLRQLEHTLEHMKRQEAGR